MTFDEIFIPVGHEVGKSFEMKFPLPSDLAEKYKSRVLTVQGVIYLGVFSNEFINLEIDAGRLKVMYRIVTWDMHHIVSFGGDSWVNDLLPFEDKPEFYPFDMTEN